MSGEQRRLANAVLVEGRRVSYIGSIATILAILTVVFAIGAEFWSLLTIPMVACMLGLFITALSLNRRCDSLGDANNALAETLETAAEEEPGG